MEQSTAERRLVKSPPELWAEVSNQDTLSRRLAPFGEIRITRVDPETTVAWEGDRASGTVELAPAGWGTKVKLTATVAATQEPAAYTPEPVAIEPEPAPEPEPVSVPPPAAATPPPHPTPEPPRHGFLARLFRRQQAAPVPSPPAPDPEPLPPAPDPAPVLREPEPEPAPVAVATAQAVPTVDTDAILADVLDDLGAAHHRPFSRD